MENRVLIDWLTFTCQFPEFEIYQQTEYFEKYNLKSAIEYYDFIADQNNIINTLLDEFLDMSPADFSIDDSGLYGYKKSMSCGHIRIMWDHKAVNSATYSGDCGVCVSMSGAGCAEYVAAKHDIISLLKKVKECPFTKPSRIDLAFDDFTGLFDLDVISEACASGDIITNAKKYHDDKGDRKFGSNEIFGRTIYIGAFRRSDIFARFYDKKLEQHRADLTHWVRLEFQIQHERAQALLNFDWDSDEDLIYNFFLVVNNYMRFLDPLDPDKNNSRRASAVWWSDFLNHSEVGKLTIDKDYCFNKDKLAAFLATNCRQAICVGMTIFGFEQFFKILFNYDLKSFNIHAKKYKDLISSVDCSDPEFLERFISEHINIA